MIYLIHGKGMHASYWSKPSTYCRLEDIMVYNCCDMHWSFFASFDNHAAWSPEQTRMKYMQSMQEPVAGMVSFQFLLALANNILMHELRIRCQSQINKQIPTCLRWEMEEWPKMSILSTSVFGLFPRYASFPRVLLCCVILSLCTVLSTFISFLQCKIRLPF